MNEAVGSVSIAYPYMWCLGFVDCAAVATLAMASCALSRKAIAGAMNTLVGGEANRVSAGALRRLAGGVNVAALRKALDGWQAKDVDAACDKSGKTPMMMAAWRGSIDNVVTLLELGCDVNCVACGEYTWGKSAIFFATTRCRDDVAALLIARGASLRLVNNKGQTPRSLAVSHLSEETLALFVSAEGCGEWQNYRATHSDGCVYGDLDLRFLDRDIQADDVIVDVCVNPTTRQSRRGNFERNNPGVTRSTPRVRAHAPADSTPPPPAPRVVEEIAAVAPPDEIAQRILETYGKASRSWQIEVARELAAVVPRETLCRRLATITEASRESRLIRRALGVGMRQQPANDKSPMVPDGIEAQLSNLQRCPQRGGKATLAEPALYIMSEDDLPHHLPHVLFIDVEFGDDGELATLQLAWIDEDRPSAPVAAVIERRAISRPFVRRFLGDHHLIAFCTRNDFKALKKSFPQDYREPRCLDLQSLAVRRGVLGSRHRPPSLAALVNKCLGLTLDKTFQQAAWGSLPRPLSSCLVHYAALDAAILPFLVLPCLTGNKSEMG